MSYEQFENSKNLESIDESKISDITKNVLNKSRELGTKTKEAIIKIGKLGKREARQTLMALDIISKKMLKGKKINDEEKQFLKSQAKDLAKLIPLIAVSGIPVPIPITPFLIAYGKKFGIDLIPKDQIEPVDYKDKTYNPVTAIKNKRASNKGFVTESSNFTSIVNIEDYIEETKKLNPHNPHDEGLKNIIMHIEKQLDLIKDKIKPSYMLKGNIEYSKMYDSLESLESFSVFNIEFENYWGIPLKYEVEFFEIEGGKIVIIAGDLANRNLTDIYFDQAFLDSNFFRSLNGINKYNL